MMMESFRSAYRVTAPKPFYPATPWKSLSDLHRPGSQIGPSYALPERGALRPDDLSGSPYLAGGYKRLHAVARSDRSIRRRFGERHFHSIARRSPASRPDAYFPAG